MSGALLTLDPTRFNRELDTAVGEDARRVRIGLLNLRRSMPVTVSFDTERYQAQRALWEIVQECLSPNWDGYGAVPANVVGFRRAWSLLENLPKDIPVPSPAIHPDGEIALEWQGSGASILTITFSADAWIKWAAMIGGERLYGRLPYAESLPTRLHRLVSEVAASKIERGVIGHGGRRTILDVQTTHR